MPPNAAKTKGTWLLVIAAVGLSCGSAHKLSRQQHRPALLDFSRFFGHPSSASASANPVRAATSEEEAPADDRGFVQPLDFDALFREQNVGSSSPSSTNSFLRQPSQFGFGAQSSLKPKTQKQSSFKFVADPHPVFGATTKGDDGFRPQDFAKSKRGAKQKSSYFDSNPYAPIKASQKLKRQQSRKASQKVEDPFDEDEGFDNIEPDEVPFGTEEESEEDGRVTAASASPKRKEKEVRYPKYSSYYHAVPTGRKQEEQVSDDDDVYDAERDDTDGPFGSGEDDDLTVKSDDSIEDEIPSAPLRAKSRPSKYSASSTSPKSARPLASATNKKKAAFKDDPFFEDPAEFSAVKSKKGKSAALTLPQTGYVDRTIRPIKYSKKYARIIEPLRPSARDPLFSRAFASVPSYDYDHSPSAEYKEVHLKPQKVAYSRSASLTEPVLASETPTPSTSSSKSAPNKKANCKRVEKQISDDQVANGRFRRDAMTCFVCDDPKSGGTYEQCAYGTEPQTQAFYVGRSRQFRSDKDKPFAYRQRRFLKYKPVPSASPVSLASPGSTATALRPIDDNGALNRKTRQEHDEGFSDFSYDPESALDEKEDYRFGPEYFVDDGEAEPEESAQLKTAESSKADSPGTPSNCQKKTKGNMICMVCTEKKTGGNYEQCSYASEPKKQSYSYGKTKSYGTPKKDYSERHRRYIEKNDGASKTPKEKFGGAKEKADTTPKRRRNDAQEEHEVDDMDDDLPKEIAEKSEPITGEVEISQNIPRTEDPELDKFEFDHDMFKKPEEDTKESRPEEKEQEPEPTDNVGKQSKYDDYFSFLFPDYNGKGNVKKINDHDDSFDHEDDDHYPAESKDLTTDFLVPDYFASSEPKKDLEKMLGEFTQKDRSECKKVMKDQMTCFQCVDSKGMQHEECMFVAASEPTNKHMAYHESTEFKAAPKKKDEGQTKTAPADVKTGPDSIPSLTADAKTASTTTVTTTAKPANRSRGSKKHESVPATSTPSPSTTATTQNKSRKRDTQGNSLLRRTRGAVPLDKKNNKNTKKAEKVQRDGSGEESEVEVEEETPGSEEIEGSAAVAATAAESISSDQPPGEFKVPEGPEGLYSEETKPVFDKRLQLSLPKYMLSKSEHEALFDEVLSSGV